ncbi:MAG: ABC transporter ATP-binding protein [Clostridium sp.]|uniref:ABC transporter ATP-binding protein n=1 Tax=Clostridium sp. TaxID=1506 RepID=UPI0029120D0A|nr:ABC transporter ATP-binding protein [Clostridium sp.]MDU7338716.1 ABC transporter ATP-binding protein [Clostridium sp.]
MGAMLSVQDLVVNYGSIRAIKGISFEVNQGEIVTLIGANGAGKTTTLHAISGLVKTKSGSVSFCDSDLLGTEPHKILGLGMAHVPEGRRVFSRMTVMENLQMGAYIRNDASGISEDYDMVFDRLPRLKERRKQAAGTLSGGEQQMLAIGRALMGRPKMLLLDEPSMGLSPLLAGEIFKIISDVNDSGVTVLLVEQNAKKALEIADRAYVLETGKVVMSGNTEELADNEEVRKAYLGG